MRLKAGSALQGVAPCHLRAGPASTRCQEIDPSIPPDQLHPFTTHPRCRFLSTILLYASCLKSGMQNETFYPWVSALPEIPALIPVVNMVLGVVF